MSLLRALTVWLALLFAGPALAHATLVTAHPAEGVMLAQAPVEVQLRFNEPVTPLVLRLIDAKGQTHELTARAEGETVRATLPGDLPRGSQLLSYRVVSADGHPVGASLTFSIGAAGSSPAAAGADMSRARAIWLVTAAVLLICLGGSGLVAFFAFLAPGTLGARGRGLIARALGLGAGFVILSVGLQGLDLLDLPARRLTSIAPWSAALDSPFGVSAGCELAALALAAAALASSSPRAMRILAALALLSAGIARAASGHAATAAPEWLMRPAVLLHALCVGIWIGSLPGLLWLAIRRPDAFPAALKRFSGVALATVAVLVVTGVSLAVVQAPRIAALPETAYGQILIGKLLLVAALLGLAAWNRRSATPRVLAGDEHARGQLVRTISLEMLLVLAILGLVAGWRFTPPPRSLLAAPSSQLLHLHGERMMAMVQVEPGRIGENELRLQLLDAAFGPLPAREVSVAISAAALGIERRETKARLIEEGVWLVPAVVFPVRGRWTISVDALVSDFEMLSVEDSFELRP